MHNRGDIMFNFGTQELILVLIIALVVFGPGKLPDVGRAIGKSINEFKGAMTGDKSADKTTEKNLNEEKIDEATVKPLKKDE